MDKVATTTTETVPVICAWCNLHYADKTMETAAHDMIKGQPTHGICPDCFLENLSGLHVGNKVKLHDANITGVIQYLSIKHKEPIYHIKLDDFPQTVARERASFEVIR